METEIVTLSNTKEDKIQQRNKILNLIIWNRAQGCSIDKLESAGVKVRNDSVGNDPNASLFSQTKSKWT